MKLRDYLFWTAITLCSLVAGHWLRVPTKHAPDPTAPRSATWLERTTYWLAVWRLAHGAPRMPPPPATPRQELPDHVANARPEPAFGADGQALIDHSAGW